MFWRGLWSIFWRGHYYLCLFLACHYLCCVFWRCLRVYFDVVINLISLTDCPLFLCDNFPWICCVFWCGLLFLCDKFTKTQDFCLLLAWSLKCVLAWSLLVLCVLACHYLCCVFWCCHYSVFWRGHLFNSSDRSPWSFI